MEWYEEEVCALERRLRESPPAAGPLIFYGSSSMRMWDSLADDFPRQGVLNLAFGGSTLAACAWFFERLVVPCRPRAIVCYAGDNDLGDGRRPEEVLASFRELLEKVARSCPQAPFTMLSIKPSPSRWDLADRIRATNEGMRRELSGCDNRYFIDIFSAMLGSGGLPDRRLFLEDGLHVSPEGYRIWRGLLAERAADCFGRPDAGNPRLLTQK
jgi:lysophospholipase L1-like esterase